MLQRLISPSALPARPATPKLHRPCFPLRPGKAPPGRWPPCSPTGSWSWGSGGPPAAATARPSPGTSDSRV